MLSDGAGSLKSALLYDLLFVCCFAKSVALLHLIARVVVSTLVLLSLLLHLMLEWFYFGCSSPCSRRGCIWVIVLIMFPSR
jgi:hypothetical protein